MRKKLICLCATLVFVLGLAAVGAAAVLQGEIWYGGYVSKYSTQLVDADTAIWVFTPKNAPIKVKMIVLNKYGEVVWSGYLLNGNAEIQWVKKYRYGWRTLGQVVGPCEPQKFTFKLSFLTAAGAPPMAKMPVVEVKEMIFTEHVNPGDIMPGGTPSYDKIKTWSETSLGGNYGTGAFWVSE